MPAQGSLGASGNLAPLAHLTLPLIGEGEAFFNGAQLPGGEAMATAGIKPLVLQAKEGLALLNGTAFMVGLGAIVVRRAINLALTADIAAALTLEALQGTDRAYDDRVHQLRPHPRRNQLRHVSTPGFGRHHLAAPGPLAKRAGPVHPALRAPGPWCGA